MNWASLHFSLVMVAFCSLASLFIFIRVFYPHSFSANPDFSSYLKVDPDPGSRPKNYAVRQISETKQIKKLIK